PAHRTINGLGRRRQNECSLKLTAHPSLVSRGLRNPTPRRCPGNRRWSQPSRRARTREKCSLLHSPTTPIRYPTPLRSVLLRCRQPGPAFDPAAPLRRYWTKRLARSETEERGRSPHLAETDPS